MATTSRHIHSNAAPFANNASATNASAGVTTGGGGASWRAGESARESAREGASARVCVRDGIWYRIDDEEVVAVSEAVALSQRDAYILFYQQTTPLSPHQQPLPPHYQQQQEQQQQLALVGGPCHAHNHGLALGLKIPLRATVKTGDSPCYRALYITPRP